MEEINQQSQSPQPVNSTPPAIISNKSKAIPIVLGVAVAIVIAIGAYALGSKQSQPVVQNIVQTTPIPSPTPNPTANPDSIGANWKTYTNDKYGFKIKYPNNWNVKTRGTGEEVSATGNESTFSITDEAVEGKKIIFDIVSLGSERLGSYYSSAKNLDDYINILNTDSKDEKGNIIRIFIKEFTVDGRRAVWFETYGWQVDKQAFVWVPGIYFQDKNNIYEVRPSGTIDLVLLYLILSTFKFTQ